MRLTRASKRRVHSIALSVHRAHFRSCSAQSQMPASAAHRVSINLAQRSQAVCHARQARSVLERLLPARAIVSAAHRDNTNHLMRKAPVQIAQWACTKTRMVRGAADHASWRFSPGGATFYGTCPKGKPASLRAVGCADCPWRVWCHCGRLAAPYANGRFAFSRHCRMRTLPGGKIQYARWVMSCKCAP